VHETAEERSCTLRLGGRYPAGESVVEAGCMKSRRPNALLAELEKLDVDTVAFETKCAELARSVTAHAGGGGAVTSSKPLGESARPA
jgi:hypothetical protein